jgi:hypothetical protein
MQGTATVGQLRRAGLTHVRLECHAVVLCVPFEHLDARLSPDWPFARLAQRLRCRTCGGRPAPGTVAPWAQWCAAGFQRRFKP